jgi:AcrR family transcriptional regulator
MASRTQIVAAATRAFAREGVLASRLEDIRRDAGVSVGAVYHHFADKEALHAEAWLQALASFQDGFVQTLHASADAESGVRGGVAHQVAWVTANRDAAALLYSGRPSGAGAGARLDEQNAAFFEDVLAWWRLHAGYGALRDVAPDLLHALWLGATDTYCRAWVAGTGRKIHAGVVRELADAAWQTLKGAQAK